MVVLQDSCSSQAAFVLHFISLILSALALWLFVSNACLKLELYQLQSHFNHTLKYYLKSPFKSKQKILFQAWNMT